MATVRHSHYPLPSLLQLGTIIFWAQSPKGRVSGNPGLLPRLPSVMMCTRPLPRNDLMASRCIPLKVRSLSGESDSGWSGWCGSCFQYECFVVFWRIQHDWVRTRFLGPPMVVVTHWTSTS